MKIDVHADKNAIWNSQVFNREMNAILIAVACCTLDIRMAGVMYAPEMCM